MNWTSNPTGLEPRAAGGLSGYLAECRDLVVAEIRTIIPDDGRYGNVLYDLMFDYPLREGKALRPALSIATCRALGGRLDAVVPTAAVLELYHNAFLIHDDIEDESLIRRGRPTLHQEHGVPIAVNVGDAMLSLCLEPLLRNVEVIGLGPALRILQSISRMSRESVEGQAMELSWMRERTWQLSDDDYVEMVIKKTGWYSFITPVLVGAIAGGADQSQIAELSAFARSLSVAFQIRDDVLNIDGELGAYGKEIAGDIWEGKRTLMLLHTLRTAAPDEQRAVLAVLDRSRPGHDDAEASLAELIDALVADGELTQGGRDRLQDSLRSAKRHVRTQTDVETILGLMQKYRSADYASGIAEKWASEARSHFDRITGWVPPSPHRDLLEDLVGYVHARNK
jgi:geranylgeranyl diphosphate synthase type II